MPIKNKEAAEIGSWFWEYHKTKVIVNRGD